LRRTPKPQKRKYQVAPDVGRALALCRVPERSSTSDVLTRPGDI
jgi:hypothetical protein